MTTTDFIDGALSLFTSTLSAVLSVPLLALLAVVPLTLAVVALIDVTVGGVKKM